MENLERESIVKEFAKIRSVIEASSMNYFVEDSPYSAKIHLRKTFRNDWSTRSSLHASTPQLSSRHNTSTKPWQGGFISRRLQSGNCGVASGPIDLSYD